LRVKRRRPAPSAPVRAILPVKTRERSLFHQEKHSPERVVAKQELEIFGNPGPSSSCLRVIQPE